MVCSASVADAGLTTFEDQSHTSGSWISFRKREPRFSSTMPSEAAKKARMWLTKCFSPSFSLFQCAWSALRSTSSAAHRGRAHRIQSLPLPSHIATMLQACAILRAVPSDARNKQGCCRNMCAVHGAARTLSACSAGSAPVAVLNLKM